MESSVASIERRGPEAAGETISLLATTLLLRHGWRAPRGVFTGATSLFYSECPSRFPPSVLCLLQYPIAERFG